MKKRYNLFFLLLMFNFSLFGITFWTGNVNADWFNPGNWDNGLPGPGNDVIIPSAPSGGSFPEVTAPLIQNYHIDNRGVITIQTGGSITNSNTFLNRSGAVVNIAAMSASFTNQGGTINNLGSIANSGTLTNDGGTITNQTNAEICNFYQLFNSNGGTLTNKGTIKVEATGTLNNSVTITNIDNGKITNNGTINNFVCAYIYNVSTISNYSTIMNEGFIHISSPGTISPNLPNDTNDGTTFSQNSPTGLCVNISRVLDGVGTPIVVNASELVNPMLPFCSGAGFSFNINGAASVVFDCSNFGLNSVTLTINTPVTSINCTVEVTITDPHAAIPACMPATIELSAGGEATLTTTDIFAGGFDNCGIIYLESVSPNKFNCTQLGTQSVTLNVNDGHGNQSSCNTTVAIEDNIKPKFNGTCPSYPSPFNTDADECYASINFTTPSPTDNCSVTELKAKIWDSNNNVVQNWTTNPDGQFAPDSYQIKWRAKDATGNKRTCATSFTVQDAQAPVAQCVASHAVQLSGGVGSITTADIDAGSSDNCSFNLGLSKSSFDCNDRGTHTVTMTATDDAGNTHQCTSDIEIKGTTLSIDDVTKNEGNGAGFTFFFFKIERAANGCALQVAYETIDGSATLANSDYVYSGGTAYYPPGGSNIRYVICRGVKDFDYESDESFWVKMSNPTVGVSFTKDKGEGTLVNDDAAPLIGSPGANVQAFGILSGKAKIFPNPVIQDLHISIPYHWLETDPVVVQLQDAYGKTLSAFDLTENATHVDVSVLTAGVYQLVFISKDGKRVTEQFVKVD